MMVPIDVLNLSGMGKITAFGTLGAPPCAATEASLEPFPFREDPIAACVLLQQPLPTPAAFEREPARVAQEEELVSVLEQVRYFTSDMLLYIGLQGRYHLLLGVPIYAIRPPIC
jgi:hypothetical protein